MSSHRSGAKNAPAEADALGMGKLGTLFRRHLTQFERLRYLLLVVKTARDADRGCNDGRKL
jgi:hypothetical protein